MGRAAKIILGIATRWPIAYMALFAFVVLSQFFLLSSKEGLLPSSQTWFSVLIALHFLTMLWIIVLLIIYIADVFKNDRVAMEKKTLWAVVLFMGNMIAMPIYWYLYIWPESHVASNGVSSKNP